MAHPGIAHATLHESHAVCVRSGGIVLGRGRFNGITAVIADLPLVNSLESYGHGSSDAVLYNAAAEHAVPSLQIWM